MEQINATNRVENHHIYPLISSIEFHPRNMKYFEEKYKENYPNPMISIYQCVVHEISFSTTIHMLKTELK